MKLRMVRVFVIWGVICGALPHVSRAELYKYVKNGVVHYTNIPPENRICATVGKPSSTLASLSAPKSRVIRNPSAASSSKSTAASVPYLDLIYDIAKTHDVSPELIKAVIKVESNFNYKAVSPKGAQGLMQLMPATAKRFGVTDSFDPKDNIQGGVKYLAYLFDEFGEENLDLVLAGYNAGEQAVRKYGNQIPPYKETQQYVKKVKAHFLARSRYRATRVTSIYKYVGKNGVVAFSNIPRAR